MSNIICHICKSNFEYEENGTLECLPDGYFLPDGNWICDECGSCPDCGRTLEKELDKRAYMMDGVLVPAKKCKYCEEDKV